MITDTHKLFKLLIDSKVPEKQAEVFIANFVSRKELSALEDDKLSLATKADLKIAIAEVKSEIEKSKTGIIQWMVGLFITLFLANAALIASSSFFIMNFLKK